MIDTVHLFQMSTPKFSRLSSQQVPGIISPELLLGLALVVTESKQQWVLLESYCRSREELSLLNFCKWILAKLKKNTTILTNYVLSPLNPLTYDLRNFTNIHYQTKPPSTNHLHFRWSLHPKLHFGGIFGYLAFLKNPSDRLCDPLLFCLR
jgi:hypothetical protein